MNNLGEFLDKSVYATLEICFAVWMKLAEISLYC